MWQMWQIRSSLCCHASNLGSSRKVAVLVAIVQTKRWKDVFDEDSFVCNYESSSAECKLAIPNWWSAWFVYCIENVIWLAISRRLQAGWTAGEVRPLFLWYFWDLRWLWKRLQRREPYQHTLHKGGVLVRTASDLKSIHSNNYRFSNNGKKECLQNYKV